MKSLINSGVIFNAAKHTYILNGRILRGITPILSKYICPGKYDDVPKEVLAKAAQRGSEIHGMIEAIVEGFTPAEPTAEQAAFVQCAGFISWKLTEYLVTDGDTFASAIDLVGEDGEDAILADIKTTATLDVDYLRWQLSIYAAMFEAQNPGIKVAKLYAIHIRNGQAKLVEVERIADDIVRGLLAAAKANAEWTNPLQADWTPDEDQCKELAELTRKAIEYKAKLDEIKAKIEPISSDLLANMENHGFKKTEAGGLAISVKAGSVRNIIDAEKLKAEFPEVYASVVKESTTKSSLTVKFLK